MAKDCKYCGTGEGVCPAHAAHYSVAESAKDEYAGKRSWRAPEEFRIPEHEVMTAIHRAIRAKLDEVASQEMAAACVRIRQKIPDILAQMALELSSQASFSFGENVLTVKVNMDGLTLPKVVDVSSVVDEICNVFFSPAYELPPPGNLQKGQVSAILRRYFCGAK
jgi:ferredoxin